MMATDFGGLPAAATASKTTPGTVRFGSGPKAAVTATQSLDDKAMAQWLRKSQVPTIVGRLRFDGPNNYGDDLSKVKQAQGGKWVVVWPKEFAAPGTRLLPQ